jgi:hypothetical protein
MFKAPESGTETAPGYGMFGAAPARRSRTIANAGVGGFRQGVP